MWSAVLLAFQMETWDIAEDVQPGGRVATDLDLRLDGPKRVECLVEQVAHHADLWLVAAGADVVDRQIVIDTQVALDEASHVPVMRRAIETLEDEDVTAAGRAAVALAVPLLIGVSQRRADAIA
jgi:hypothetical protein